MESIFEAYNRKGGIPEIIIRGFKKESSFSPDFLDKNPSFSSTRGLDHTIIFSDSTGVFKLDLTITSYQRSSFNYNDFVDCPSSDIEGKILPCLTRLGESSQESPEEIPFLLYIYLLYKRKSELDLLPFCEQLEKYYSSLIVNVGYQKSLIFAFMLFLVSPNLESIFNLDKGENFTNLYQAYEDLTSGFNFSSFWEDDPIFSRLNFN